MLTRRKEHVSGITQQESISSSSLDDSSNVTRPSNIVTIATTGACLPSSPLSLEHHLQLDETQPDSSLFSVPEEYGQEAMEGQGEGMLEPEGETYDETQQESQDYEPEA